MFTITTIQQPAIVAHVNVVFSLKISCYKCGHSGTYGKESNDIILLPQGHEII